MWRSALAMAAGLLIALVAPPPAFSAEAKTVESDAAWQSITDKLFNELGVWDIQPSYVRRCVGMAVAPTAGEVFVFVHKQGVCHSKDQGKTWKRLPKSELNGRGQTGFCFSLSYPFKGQMALFTIDKQGGITTDGGKTWQVFGVHHRGFDFGDVDWTAAEPRTIFALEHEPECKCLSTDGGATWTRIDEAADKQAGNREMRNARLGVVDAQTLLLGDCRKDGIMLSTDLGKTWTEVAKYRPLAGRPVHYDRKIYWATATGIIVSDDGRKWSQVGEQLDGATFGPYFGQSEAEMMVVTKKGFFITRDGAKTWTNVAPLHLVADGFGKGFDPTGQFWYFGWDPVENILYASGLGGSVQCLRLGRKP